MSANALRQLITPYPLDHFLSEIWESSHLHIARDGDDGLRGRIGRLITLDEFDDVLTRVFAPGPRPEASIRLGQDGVLISPSEYLIEQGSSGSRIDVDRVLEFYRRGASIILNRLDEVIVPLGELCRGLSDFFGVPVHANGYLTPPNCQGFPVHFDTHDVFVLQISGEKHWILHGSSVALATPALRQDGFGTPSQPVDQLCLCPDELLYIPRGMLHQGRASSVPSLHLTVGVHAYTWSDFIREAVSALERADVRFRRSVHFQLSSVESLKEHVQEMTSALSDAVFAFENVERVCARRSREQQEKTPRSAKGRLAQMVRSPSILVSTRLQCVIDATIDGCGTSVALRWNGKTLLFPAFVEPHLRVLCMGTPVSAEDLPSSLDERGKLVLVRRLVDEGVLVAEHHPMD